MKNILIAFEQWLETTECGIATTKIASILAMCWLVWLVFSYCARNFNREWLRDHKKDAEQ